MDRNSTVVVAGGSGGRGGGLARVEVGKGGGSGDTCNGVNNKVKKK